MSTPVQSLFESLEKRLPKKTSLLTTHLTKLRAWMSTDRALRPKAYINQKASFEAYLQYYLPLHLPELFWILEHNSHKITFSKISNILDLGAGPGTLSLSLQEWRNHHNVRSPINFDLVDQSTNALKFAKEQLRKTKNNTVNYHNSLLPRLPQKIHQKKYDMILIGHFLNEWGNGPKHRPKKLNFVKSLIANNLKQNGLLIIIDPPLKESTLDLMFLRDQLAQEQLNILGPCPHSQKQCPMLKERGGWCYSQVPNQNIAAQFLKRDKKIAKWLGIILNQRSFSYLALSKELETIKHKHLTSVSDLNAPRGIYCDGDKLVKKNKKLHRGDYLDL